MGIHAGPLLGWHAVPGAAGGPRARRPLPLWLCVHLVPPCPWAGCGDDQPLLETLTGQGLKNVLVSVSRRLAQRDLGSTVFRPLLVSPLFFFFLQTGHQNSEVEGMTPTTSHSRKWGLCYAPRAEASAWAPGWEGGRVGHCSDVPESWGWGGVSLSAC